MCRKAVEERQRCRSIGNALHAIMLAGIATYGVTVSRLLGKSDGGGGESNAWFDPDWLRHGFCMPHDDVPFLSTHERSGFIMIAFATLGAALVLSLNDASVEMQRAKRRVTWALFGALGHASGHAILAVTRRNGLLPDGDVSAMDEFLSPDANFVTFAKHVPGYFFFWIPLVKTYMLNVSSKNVAAFAFFAMAGSMQLPLKLGFSYALTVLFAGQSLDQLFLTREEKGFDYMLWPMVTVLPTFCITVMESAWCTESSVFSTHGHVIFDGYMALSYSLYYLSCWLWNNAEMKAKKSL